MARGTWDDFTSKYGFQDGATDETRDWEAREGIVNGLNKLLKNFSAVKFDRPGMHNGCMIFIVPKVDGKTPEEVLADYNDTRVLDGFAREAFEELDDLEDEGGVSFDIEELIREVYDEQDDDVPLTRVSGSFTWNL